MNHRLIFLNAGIKETSGEAEDVHQRSGWTSSNEHAFHVDNMKGGEGEYGHRLSGPNHRMLVGEPTLPHKGEGIGQSLIRTLKGVVFQLVMPAAAAAFCFLMFRHS